MVKDLFPPLPQAETVDQADVGGLTGRLKAITDDLLGGAFVQFASDFNGTNVVLSGSFQVTATLSFTPPDDWKTYKVQVEGWCLAGGLTSGDSLQAVLQGGGAGTGEITDDNSSGATRTVLAYNQGDATPGAQSFTLNVRNNTASRGTAYSSGMRLIAVRTS